MYVIWNYSKNAPTTLDGIVLHETYEDALRVMHDNGIDYIGMALTGDCYIVEKTTNVIRNETIGERLRDYYLG